MASALRHGLSRPAAPLLRSQPLTTTTAIPTTSTASQIPSFLRAPIPPPSARLFSTTAPAQVGRTGYPNQGIPRDQFGGHLPIPKPNALDEHIPPYPYGPRRLYKQSNTGLYGQARIRFGNNVSEKHDVKTHRRWRPNVHRRRLWSEALRCFVQTRVTTRVLRTIDKCGGLDEYLLGEKAQRIKDLGPWGWKLRWRIMQSEVVQERFARQRVAMGLAGSSEEDMEQPMLGEPETAGKGLLREAGKQEAMAEMDRLINSEEDFALGEEAEAPIDEGFMKEEKS